MTPALREQPGVMANTYEEVSAVAKATPEERFWAKVDRNGPAPDYAPELGPCWIWKAALSRGYGNFWDGTKRVKAHRFSYELEVGPVADGLDLDHLCRVRSCVRPSHLEPVTRAVNLRRGEGWTAINARKTHCPQGHEYTPENTRISRKDGWRYCRACSREWVYRKRHGFPIDVSEGIGRLSD